VKEGYTVAGNAASSASLLTCLYSHLKYYLKVHIQLKQEASYLARLP